MSKNTQIEIWVGAFVAAGFVALFFLAMQVSNLGSANHGGTYQIAARFDNIGGLKIKSPVTMAGVEVGRVTDIYFDKEDFRAVVEIGMYEQYDNIPDDTFAKILTAGLLGEQYIGLDVGGSEDVLEDGGVIETTQSALVLEEIISQVLFDKAEGGSN